MAALAFVGAYGVGVDEVCAVVHGVHEGVLETFAGIRCIGVRFGGLFEMLAIPAQQIVARHARQERNQRERKRHLCDVAILFLNIFHHWVDKKI
jgi:hypothetical protein